MEIFDRALLICESLLEEMELERISTSSALLRCLRIARLVHDYDAMQWLRLEHGGYPRNPDGSVPGPFEEIARAHGRICYNNGTERIFYSLASELEKKLENCRYVINKQFKEETWISAEEDGHFRASQMGNDPIRNSIQILNRAVREQRQLMSLNAAYYDYVLRKYNEISAGSSAESIFTRYRLFVNHAWNRLGEPAALSMGEMASCLKEGQPSDLQKILQICRELIRQILDENQGEEALSGQTAFEISLLQHRLEEQAAGLQSGRVLTNAELYGSVIRTYIGAAELLLDQTKKEE